MRIGREAEGSDETVGLGGRGGGLVEFPPLFLPTAGHDEVGCGIGGGCVRAWAGSRGGGPPPPPSRGPAGG